MEFIPLDDRVLLRRHKREERSASGLYIPTQAKRDHLDADVVAVGPGRPVMTGERLAMQVAVGDIVRINSWEGHEVDIDGETLVVVSETDILGIVKE